MKKLLSRIAVMVLVVSITVLGWLYFTYSIARMSVLECQVMALRTAQLSHKNAVADSSEIWRLAEAAQIAFDSGPLGAWASVEFYERARELYHTAIDANFAAIQEGKNNHILPPAPID